jgi:hypothetical protein
MKRLVLALSLCLALGAISPLAAGADQRPLDSYCSRSGDYCISVLGPKADPVFELRTFSFTGQYKLCLRNAPYERQCGWWKLKRGAHDTYGSRVRLNKYFFLEGAGYFTISAFYGDAERQLGRGLHFRRG